MAPVGSNARSTGKVWSAAICRAWPCQVAAAIKVPIAVIGEVQQGWRICGGGKCQAQGGGGVDLKGGADLPVAGKAALTMGQSKGEGHTAGGDVSDGPDFAMRAHFAAMQQVAVFIGGKLQLLAVQRLFRPW